MKGQVRLAIYVGAAATLLLVLLIAPGAWAEPLQNRHGQTVPTRTPVGSAPPTAAPPPAATSVPQEPPSQPAPPAGPTAEPPVAPAPGEAPPATPQESLPARSPLSLTKEASRSAVYPGAIVRYTLTLTNRGTASVRNVVVEDTLPAGLEPAAVEGSEAEWQGRTLTARRPILPPGGRMVLTFTVIVTEDNPPGGVIVNTAEASAPGSLRVTASATLVLPPVELPRTGAGEGGHPAGN